MKRASGIVLVLAGVVLLLHTLGVLSFPTIWPVAIMAAGLAFLVRAPGVGATFLAIALLLGIAGLDIEEAEMQIQEIQSNPAFDRVEIDLAFGAGSLSLRRGTSEALLRNVMVGTGEPIVRRYNEGSRGMISLRRASGLPVEENWNITVTPGLPLSVSIGYGAAEVHLDLTDLMVESLAIAGGASETIIRFGTYPTKAVIDIGASDLTLEFPRGIGAVVTVDGRAVSVDLPGFSKTGQRHVTENYRGDGTDIEISIDAGAASIQGRFYEVGE